MDKSKWKYPAFIRQEKGGEFGVYFPTLFSDVGWDYPLSRGNTKDKAIEKAKKELAYTIAGIIYDNDVAPNPVTISTEHLSEDLEVIEIETYCEDYKKEINYDSKSKRRFSYKKIILNDEVEKCQMQNCLLQFIYRIRLFKTEN